MAFGVDFLLEIAPCFYPLVLLPAKATLPSVGIRQFKARMAYIHDDQVLAWHGQETGSPADKMRQDAAVRPPKLLWDADIPIL